MFEITLLAHLCFFKNKTDFAVLDQSKVPFTTMLSMSSFSGYICISFTTGYHRELGKIWGSKIRVLSRMKSATKMFHSERYFNIINMRNLKIYYEFIGQR